MYQGKLNIGSSSFPTYFKDNNKVFVFRDKPFPGDYYQVNLIGGSTVNTSIFMGDKVSGQGVSGCAFRAVGAAKYKVLINDTSVNTLGLYGCSFYDANTILCQAYDVNKEILNTAFSAGSMILAQETVFTNCNFISADSIAVQIDDTNFKITSCNFISNPVAIELVSLPNGSTITFNNLKFSGNNIDVRNSTGGTITILKTSGSDPTTQDNPNGGTINFVSALNINITVKDSSGNPISGARVAVYDANNRTEGAEIVPIDVTDNNGNYSKGYSGSVTNIVIVVRKSSAGSTRYYPVEMPGTLTGVDFNLTVTMYVDPTA